MTGHRWTAPLAGFLIVLLIAVTPARANDHLDASADFIRTLADRAIATLTAESMTPESRRDEFRDLFREGFAVTGIGKWVLGRYWNTVSEAERTEYLVLFEDVIVNIWADRFSSYSGQEFTVDGAVNAPSAHPQERVALVNSTFFVDPQTPIPIEWRVSSRGDIFKITDVKVEGRSLAQTQKADFTSVLRQNDGEISSLLDWMRQKRESG